MNRRSLPAAAVFATAAALLLTGCGGGGDSNSKDSGKIAGADQGASKSPSPSASASSGAPGRPKVTLPSGLKMTFEGAATGDPAKDAVLSDGAERMRAINGAVGGTDPKYAALNFYNTGKALAEASSWVEKFKQAGLSITGSITYFNRQATIDSSKSASLTFCADESKAYSKKIKTGKIITTAPSKNDFILYRTGLVKNSDGVWQTSQIVSTAGAATCVK